MILTKRRFLSGSAALAVGSVGFGAIADPEPPAELRIEAAPTTLRVRRDGPDVAALGYAAQDVTVLRIKKGQTLAGRLSNRLHEPTSLVWHGLRGVNEDLAVSAVEPGATAAFRLSPVDGGVSWFHAAPGPENQTGRGLFGALVVEEAEPPAVDHDLVCLLADWIVDERNVESGAATPPSRPEITWNNRPTPVDQAFAPGARLRLRFINASTRRVMVVACEGARPMIISIDGQPSELFEPIRATIPIGPGARFEWLVDLPRDADATVRLILRGTERVEGALEADRVLSTIRTEGQALTARAAMAPLPVNPALPARIPLEASKRASLVLDLPQSKSGATPTWTINGISGTTLPAEPLLRVKRGSAVTLGLENTTQTLVALRVHGQAMRLLHPNDDGWEPYWRDTVLLPPKSRNHVAFVADLPGRWLVDGPFNDQAVAGLRSWFEVTA